MIVWFACLRQPNPTSRSPVDDDDEREARLAVEVTKAYKAAEAVTDSIESVHAEATRLRDSREVAAALRAHVRENGFTERIAASMRLRDKGASP